MICNQNRTPVTKKLACISQMWTSWFSCAASNKAGTCQSTITTLKEMSAVHGLTTKRPTARNGCEQATEQHGPQEAPTWPDGQAVQQGQPRRSGHNEDRGEEGDEDVLDHVDEEVVVGPVVDGRHHRDQEQGQTAVEEQGAQPPGPGPFGTGTTAEVGQADLVEHHDDGHDDHEGVEAPVVDQIAHADRPCVAGMLPVTVPRRALNSTSRRPGGSGSTALGPTPCPRASARRRRATRRRP